MLTLVTINQQHDQRILVSTRKFETRSVYDRLSIPNVTCLLSSQYIVLYSMVTDFKERFIFLDPLTFWPWSWTFK